MVKEPFEIAFIRPKDIFRAPRRKRPRKIRAVLIDFIFGLAGYYQELLKDNNNDNHHGNY